MLSPDLSETICARPDLPKPTLASESKMIYNRKKEGNDEPSILSLINLIVLPDKTTPVEHVAASPDEETDTTAAEHVASSSHVETVSALVPTNNTLASPQDIPLDPNRVNSLFPSFDDTDNAPVEEDCIMLGYRDPEIQFITQKCMCPACRPNKATPPEIPTSKTFRH